MTLREIRLGAAANEMVQEEILKQVAHISRSVRDTSFRGDGITLSFDVPDSEADRLVAEVSQVATKVARSLRSLTRKTLHVSASAPGGLEAPPAAPPEGVRMLGEGQAALQGLPLALFRFFDRTFREWGEQWQPVHLQPPTLIPAAVLAKCDYFRSFPQYVTFAAHLSEASETIQQFRERHLKRDDLDEASLGDMAIPTACLSPAVCYHVYHLHAGEQIPPGGRTYSVAGKCFRFETTNLQDLRRLWDFTMRELVFVGSREWVLDERQRAIEAFIPLLDSLGLAAEIRTASDPFFVAPDAASKTYFQLSSETKYEIALAVPGESHLAVGSFNYHGDFFGRAFEVKDERATPMHSVCVAFGLERWVHGFLRQRGTDRGAWPALVRDAPELGDR